VSTVWGKAEACGAVKEGAAGGTVEEGGQLPPGASGWLSGMTFNGNILQKSTRATHRAGVFILLGLALSLC